MAAVSAATGRSAAILPLIYAAILWNPWFHDLISSIELTPGVNSIQEIKSGGPFGGGITHKLGQLRELPCLCRGDMSPRHVCVAATRKSAAGEIYRHHNYVAASRHIIGWR
jgi:hypothetical protein